MIGLLIATWRLFRSLGQILAEPQGRALGSLVGLQLLIGTVTYHFVEGWSYLNSLYFSVTTLATVGYGDFVPTTTLGKAFTIAFILSGVGLIGAFLTYVAQRAPFVQHAIQRQEHRRDTTDGSASS